MKKKILFLLQLPPPVHGASMVNLNVRDSEYINSRIEANYVDISPAHKMTDLGLFSFGKLFLTLTIIIRCIFEYLKFRPVSVYITLSPHGFGFWKDALILHALKALGAKFIIHLHGKGIHSAASGSRIKRIIYRSVFKGVNVIHLSKSLFSDLNLVFDKKMSLLELNNGVENNNTKNFSRSSEKMIFLYLSNFVPTKGADTLVRALNLLDDSYEGRFRVKLVGKISNKIFYDELVAGVDERFKDHVSFLGPLYGEEKCTVFRASHVFCIAIQK